MFYCRRNKTVRPKAVLFGFALSLLLVLVPHNALSSNQSILNDFNRLMVSISSDSLSTQMEALQRFIRDYPDFEPAYRLLLERYVYRGKISEARAFFHLLAGNADAHRNSVWMLAKIHSMSGEVQTALEFYRQALLGDRISYPLIEDILEFTNEQSEQPDDSVLFQNLPIRKEDRLIISAISNYKKSRYEKSIQTFSELSEDEITHPFLFHIYGDCYFRRSNYQQADSLWKLGLTISEEIGDLQYQAVFLNNLAKSARKAGEHQAAISYFDSAYAVANRIGDLHQIQQVAGDYATALRFRGRFTDALPLHQRAIEIADKLGMNDRLAGLYFSYAQTLYNIGSFNDALAAYDSSQSKALISTDQERLLVQTEYCRGDIYKNMNQFALARSVYEKAYQLAVANNFSDLKNNAQRRLADLMLMVGENEDAIRVYKEFLKSTSSMQAKCYANRQIGEAYITKEQYDSARIFYSKALEIAHQANYRLYIGWCAAGVAKLDLLTARLDDAIQRYKSVLHIATEIARTDDNYGLLIEALKGLGDTYKASGDLEKAIASYRHASKMIEESREKLRVEQLQIGYFSTVSEIYRKLVNCYQHRFLSSAHQADLDSVFYFTEMARARSLKDLRFREEPVPHQLANDAVHAEYQRLCVQLRLQQRYLRKKAMKSSYSEKERDSLYTALEMTRYSLISKRLRLIEQTSPSILGQVPSLQTVLEDLKQSGLGLLIYHIDREASFVLAAADTQVKLIPLDLKAEELQSSVVALVSPFHHLAVETILSTPFRAEIAHELYQSLIKPAEDSLALPQQLVIVPDIALLSLPFEMLLVEAPDKSEYNLQDEPSYASYFLQNRYSITYSPTTYLLLEESEEFADDPSILVYANPFEDLPLLAENRTTRQWDARKGWRFDPLPFAEREAKRIKDIFTSTKVLKRDQASKASFLKEAPKYDIIHIATHGFVDSTFDAFSGLVLAAGDNSYDDGLIMGYEISDKKLNCDLIALSACETGLGKRVAGEGVLGLPRLFLGAGAKSVLMTLWKVDDQFTSELMPEFYRLYLHEKLSKAEALAQAKRMVLSREIAGNGSHYQHPFFWASFTLFGSPGKSLDLKSDGKWKPSIPFILTVIALASLIFFSIHSYRRKTVSKGPR